MNSFLDQTKKLISKKNIVLLIFLIIGLILSGILEMIGIGILPTFILLIARPNQVIEFSSMNLLNEFLLDLDRSEIILLSSIILIIFFIIKNIYLIFLAYCESKIIKSITNENSIGLFNGYIKIPYLSLVYKSPSILLRNMTETVESASSFVRCLISIIKETLVVLFLFVLLLFSDWQASIGIFCLLLLISSIFYLSVRKNVKRKGEIVQNLRGNIIKLINQSIGSIKYVKISGKENFFVQEHNKIINTLLNSNIYLEILTKVPRFFLEILAIISILLVVSFFIYLDRPIHLMLPFLSLLALAVIRLVPSFNVISSNLAVLRFNWEAVRILNNEFEYIEQNKKIHLKENEINKINDKKFVINEISLKNISFSYPNNKSQVIKDISMNIKIGTSVAIVGPSGAGKSTLIDIILGLLEPTTGKISINDKPLDENISFWHNQIGFVPQDIYLNDDTIKNNIAFAQKNEQIDNYQVVQALKLSKLYDFVQSLPDGVNTHIGHRGVKLSGGQIQRLGIARCIYNDPKILIMDEATSSLDYETERKIIESINEIKKDRTVVVIAHRYSTIKNSDVIYYLRDGKLVDKGNFDELQKNYPIFFDGK